MSGEHLQSFIDEHIKGAMAPLAYQALHRVQDVFVHENRDLRFRPMTYPSASISGQRPNVPEFYSATGKSVDGLSAFRLDCVSNETDPTRPARTPEDAAKRSLP